MNAELLEKGYPDIGWDPVEGERFLDFFRFCVWNNGEIPVNNFLYFLKDSFLMLYIMFFFSAYCYDFYKVYHNISLFTYYIPKQYFKKSLSRRKCGRKC